MLVLRCASGQIISIDAGRQKTDEDGLEAGGALCRQSSWSRTRRDVVFCSRSYCGALSTDE